MPRPRSLNLSTIATAALTVVDREGLSALSMRTVAAELGMGTMSLYRYVERREQLETLVVDLVLADVNTTVPASAAWDKRVRLLASRMRDAVAEHPGVVQLLMLHRHTSTSVMRCAEALLGPLTEAGIRGRHRVIALRTIVSYVLGALQAQHLSPLRGPGTARMAELPAEIFPLLSATARQASKVTPRQEFDRGLDAVLRGLDGLRSQR